MPKKPSSLSSIPEDDVAEPNEQTPEKKLPPPLKRQQASQDLSALLATSLLKKPTDPLSDQGIGASPPSSLIAPKK